MGKMKEEKKVNKIEENEESEEKWKSGGNELK